MRTLRLPLFALLISFVTLNARADDQRFFFSEFNLGAARAVQGGGAAIGPLLVYLPHYELRLGDRSASLGLEVGVTSFRDRGRAGFVGTQYGAYQAFQPLQNLELRLAAGMQRWENTKETSPYFLAEARVLLNHADRHFLKGFYAFYSYVAHDRRTEVSGGGLVLHWPTSVREQTPAPIASVEPVVTTTALPEAASADLPELTMIAAPSATSAATTPSADTPPAQVEVIALTPPPVAVEPLKPEVPPSLPTGPAPDDQTTALINGTQSGTFEPNSVFIGQVYKAKLKSVAEAMLQTPSVKIDITGFAEVTERQPDELARRRARAVKTWLVAAGVQVNRLDVLASKTPATDQKNVFADVGAASRRVELRVTKPVTAASPAE